MADTKPTLDNTSQAAAEAAAAIAAKIAEIEAKLPAGVTLSDQDLKNIVSQFGARVTPAAIQAFLLDLFNSVRKGSGPNTFDAVFFG